MTKAPIEYQLVQIELREKVKKGGASKSGVSSSKDKAGGEGRRKDQGRSESPITCFGSGQEGHTFRHCKTGKQGGGNGGKSNGASGSKTKGRSAGVSRANVRMGVNNARRLLRRDREQWKEEPYSRPVEQAAGPSVGHRRTHSGRRCDSGGILTFNRLVSDLDSMRASQAPGGLGFSPAPGSLASELLSEPQNSVAAWRSVAATGGDLQVASLHSTLSVDVTVPGSGGTWFSPNISGAGQWS